MLRGYRFLIAAACGLVLLVALGTGAFFGSLYGPDRKHYETVAGEQPGQSDYAGPSQSMPDIAGLPAPVERAIANPRPPGGEDHVKRDLAAQEASALWAFWMVVASFASVLITSVGTILLYRQIVLTREAVEDTGKATEAMERQNELADQSQRPWIEIELEFGFISKVQDGFLLATNVKLKNIGRMPAYHAKIDHFMIHRYRNPLYDFQIAAEMPWEEGRMYESDLIVLPGGTAQDQELIHLVRDDPGHPFNDGVVPHLMITVRYELPDGRPAQSSAWFVISMPENETGHQMIRWDWEPDGTNLLVEAKGYIRVT